MRILAIETSCDETAAAIVEAPLRTRLRGVEVLSSVVASSQEMHIKTGGIVPEVASREQIKAIIIVIQQALAEARISKSEIRNKIDAVAVTVGPGLVGSLLVGVETAKTLAYAWDKPIIPVNHLLAHLYANWVNPKFETLNSKQIPNSKFQIPNFPAIGLVVSGGHTDLVLMEKVGSPSHKATEGRAQLRWLGGARDDAAGECFDKCARLLGLGYPGGPAIGKASQQILNSKFETLNKFKIQNSKFKINLPRPLLHEDTYDFSFSGLKTAVAREVQKVRDVQKLRKVLAYELQEAVAEVLVAKLMKAVEEFKPKSVLLGGGVAANSRLRELLKAKCQTLNAKLFIPPLHLCTDNAVTIGAEAYYVGRPTPWQKVVVDPGLEII